jgi:hypothetical protein
MRSSFRPGVAFLYFSLLKTTGNVGDWPPIKIRLHKLRFYPLSIYYLRPLVLLYL